MEAVSKSLPWHCWRLSARPYAKPSSSSLPSPHSDTEDDSLLRIHPLDAATLKSETCPRISAEDVIDIAGIRINNSLVDQPPTPLNQRPKILVVDVRNEEDYFRGCVESSVNIPFESAFAPDGTFEPSPNAIALENHKVGRGGG